MLSVSSTCLFLRVHCVVAVYNLPLHLLFVQVDDVSETVVGLQDLRCAGDNNGEQTL